MEITKYVEAYNTLQELNFENPEVIFGTLGEIAKLKDAYKENPSEFTKLREFQAYVFKEVRKSEKGKQLLNLWEKTPGTPADKRAALIESDLL